MNKLNLVPNEIVGYRVLPDTHNWTVVMVKRRGKDSKNAGQEYETPLAYCKGLENAADWVMGYVSKVEGRRIQDETFDREGVLADMESLKQGMTQGKKAVAWMLQDLERRLSEKGLDFETVKDYLKSADTAEAEATEIGDEEGEDSVAE
jgi:hypothetical protein